MRPSLGHDPVDHFGRKAVPGDLGLSGTVGCLLAVVPTSLSLARRLGALPYPGGRPS